MLRPTLSISSIIACGLLGSLLAGCNGRPGENAVQSSPSAPVAVRTSVAAAIDSPSWFDAIGTVNAQFAADIGTRSSGRVTAVTVKEGDPIRKGQPLVLLDARELDASVAQANADIRACGAQYQGALAAARMASATTGAQIATAASQVDQAKAALAAALAKRALVDAGPRRQERLEAVQNVARANASLVLAQKTYGRMSNLYKNDAITGQQLDAARSDLDGAQAGYQSALQQQSMTDEGSRVEDRNAVDAEVAQARAGLEAAQAALAQARAGAQVVNVRREDVRQAQAQMGRAQAALGEVEANRSYSVINAPFDGVVAQRLADPGTMAGPGVPLLHVLGGDLRIEAVVPESMLSTVRVGSSIPVSVDALGVKSLASNVISIAPQGDPGSHTFLIKVGLPAGSGARAGMFGRAHIRTGSERLLTIPVGAVVDREGLTYVYVIQGASAKLRLVSIGKTVGKGANVLSGLQAGDRVAVSNVALLADNASVSEVN